jgi:elongation factor Ts
MELRQRTGLGMMECKKALTEANGDLDKAEELLRIRSGAKASKAAGRVAAEGVIGLAVASDAKVAAMVELNCETDFVAKNDEFRAFANDIAALVLSAPAAGVDALAGRKLASGETVDARRIALVQKIGVVVDYTGGNQALGKDLAMHIAATKPIAVSREQVPADVVDKERSIAAARAAESGKPANIVEKMVEGAVSKFLAEVTLLPQPFVKNDKQSIADLVKGQGAKVNAFVLFVVGEGIEKRKDDFAAEVAAMARG